VLAVVARAHGKLVRAHAKLVCRMRAHGEERFVCGCGNERLFGQNALQMERSGKHVCDRARRYGCMYVYVYDCVCYLCGGTGDLSPVQRVHAHGSGSVAQPRSLFVGKP